MQVWVRDATVLPVTDGDEAYPHAPLVYVTCELRFPLAPSLSGDATLEALTEAFHETLPVPEEVMLSASDDASPLHVLAERLLRFTNRSRTLSVALTRTSLSVETTAYSGWTGFKACVSDAVRIVASQVRIVGIERVGLRYINEIRVPVVFGDASGWSGWVNPALLGHLGLMPDGVPESLTSLVALRRGDAGLLVRFASLNGGGAVSDEPLRRTIPASEGPCFVIDTDSFRLSPGEHMVDFDARALEPVLGDLHEPLGEIFERSVTDQARAVFRGDS